MMASSWDKSVSGGVYPSGLYSAIVAETVGDDVYLIVPKLSGDFTHGPVLYDGTVPEVGDSALVGFLEGDKDSVVAVFPGGGSTVGPVEPTFLIASHEAMDEVKAVADFVCDGVNDEEEINNAIRLSGDKSIQFTGGVFNLGGGLSLSSGWYSTLTFRGVGKYETLLYLEDVDMPDARGVFDFAYYVGDFRIYDLSIDWYYNVNTATHTTLPPRAIIAARHIELYDVDLNFEDYGADWSATPLDHVGTFGLDIESIIMARCNVWHTGSFIDIYPYDGHESRAISDNWIFAYGFVIDSHSAPNLIVENNYMESWELAPFVASVTGSRTRFSGNVVRAVYRNDSDVSPVCVMVGRYYAVVSNNYFECGGYGDTANATVVSYGTGTTISNNIFRGSTGGPALSMQGNYSTVSGNIFYWPAKEAIEVFNFYDAAITNNHVVNASYDSPAFSFSDASEIAFNGNSIDDTDYSPSIKVDDCYNFTISNTQTSEI